MKSKPYFILLLFLLNACAFNEQTVENQISAGSNRTTAANQNTNAPTVSNAAVKEEPVKREVDYFAHLKAEHREVLREWLKSKPFLRPGVEEIDSIYFENGRITSEADLKFLRETVGNNGYQYYAVGDMNRDGKKDILFQHADGTLAVWFMDGINLVQAALLNPNKPGVPGWRVVGTATSLLCDSRPWVRT